MRSFVNFLERGQRGTIPTESPISAWCMLIYQEFLLLFFFSFFFLPSLFRYRRCCRYLAFFSFVERWTEE